MNVVCCLDLDYARRLWDSEATVLRFVRWKMDLEDVFGRRSRSSACEEADRTHKPADGWASSGQDWDD